MMLAAHNGMLSCQFEGPDSAYVYGSSNFGGLIFMLFAIKLMFDLVIFNIVGIAIVVLC